MTTLASDTFVRSNQSGWGTASDGQSWTTTGSGTLTISNNEGVLVSASSDTHVQIGTNTAPDVEICCRIAIADINDICGIQGRFNPATGTTCYKLLWYGGAAHLNKSIAGTTTQMTTVGLTMTPGSFYWFCLRIIGTSGLNLFGKIWADGSAEPATWTTTASDGAVTSAGGIAMLGNTATGNVQFDHLLAVDSPYANVSASVDSFSLSQLLSFSEVSANIETITATSIALAFPTTTVIARGRDGIIVARGH